MNSKTQAFAFIDAYRDEFKITDLAKITGVSRSGFYNWLIRRDERIQELKDEEMFHYIFKVFKQSRGTYGRKRIKVALFNQFDLVVNEKRISRIMKKYGLRCQIRQKKFKRRSEDHRLVPNVLKRNFTAIKPGIKFCIDITYVKVRVPVERWTYLCAITDLYNNEIVAYAYGSSQETELVMEALTQLKDKRFENGALLHSDQGFQFTNRQYLSRLKKMGLTPSMSRRGNCWDNACIESFFSHFKTEIACFGDPKTLTEVRSSIAAYILYYNTERIQQKFGMSPQEFKQRKVA